VWDTVGHCGTAIPVGWGEFGVTFKTARNPVSENNFTILHKTC
jgi:hypothetical protein